MRDKKSHRQQALEALAVAQATKVAVTETKAKLKSGELLASDVISYPALTNYYVREVLGWQKNWGEEKVERVMNEMDAFNPVCAMLTPRQHRILAKMCAIGRGKSGFEGKRAGQRARKHAQDGG